MPIPLREDAAKLRLLAKRALRPVCQLGLSTRLPPMSWAFYLTQSR
jgi:hypothetical protein